MRRAIVMLPAVVGLLLMASLPPQAPAANFRWAAPIGGVTDDIALASATDPAGNSYVTGLFTGLADFDGIRMQSRGESDVFVVKADSIGRVLWAKRAGGTGSDEGRGITFDSDGNILVTGQFRNQADFGPTNLTSHGFEDVFLAKYSPAGQFLWVRQMGGANSDGSRGLAVDAAGNGYSSGFFRGTASFGASNLVARGGSDIFIAKHSAAGELLWVLQAGGTNSDEGRALALNARGDFWVTGTFAGTSEFGPTNLTARGADDLFLACYNCDRELVWARQAGGTNVVAADEGSAVGLDADEDCFVTGDFAPSPTLFWGSTNLPGSMHGPTIFLAKYDRAGALLWARGVIPATGGAGHALAMGPRGNAAIAGFFYPQVSFGTNRLTSRSGQADSFVANYSTHGEVIWAIHSAGPAYNVAYGVGIDHEERYYAAGWFRSDHSFGDVPAPNHGLGSRDAFLVRIDASPVLRAVPASGHITLSWPADATNFSLQTTTNLDATWTPLTHPSTIIGDRRVVTNDTTSLNRFYRLSSP